MEKKYQIFISSTFSDLVDERQEVSRAILDIGHIPAGMEMFPAADTEQLKYIKKVIDECDYYILIIGARYGSLDHKGISYTEREYEYAVSTGKTVLAFLHRNTDAIPVGKTDKDDNKRQKLNEFITNVSKERLVQFWETAMELRANAIVSLAKAFSENPQTGWVRADTAASTTTMSEIIKYRDQNDKLLIELNNLKSSLKPKFEDAADLSTEIEISFTYFSDRTKRRTNHSHTTTFHELLRWIALQLYTPSTIYGVCKAIEIGLTQRAKINLKSISVLESSANDVLMHLNATGHIKMWQSKTSDGKQVTGYKLTPLGELTWQQMSYVKATNQNETELLPDTENGDQLDDP